MDILHTPVRFVPHIGGVETYVHGLSKELVELGHDVTVVCANVSKETERRETVDGINVRRLTSVGQIANTNLTPTLPAVLIEESQAADVIHTHLPTPWFADFSALAGVATGTPVVLTYHNDIVGEGIADYVARIYNGSMLKVTLRLSDRIIVTQPDYVANSPHLSPEMSKIDVIPNGVDVDHYRPLTVDTEEQDRLGIDGSRPTLFFLSVLDGHHQYKGLTDLLEAMTLLIDSGKPTPQLLIGGDGEARPDYEQQAAEFNVEPYVDFLGQVPEEDLVSYYSAADLFVLPSTSSDQEGFGLVLLEALACGTPVVTTNVVGIADVVNSEQIGTIVPRADPDALASSIQTELSNGSFHSDTAREICERKYSWQASAKAVEAVYTDVSENSVEVATEREKP